jgi:hypothetical protein
VAHPSEPVRLHQSNRDQPPDLRQQRRNQQGKGNAGAHEMQPAGYAVGVFAEIKRVEVGEGSEAGSGVMGFAFRESFQSVLDLRHSLNSPRMA